MIETLILYAWTFLHTEYVWGGNFIHRGLDCSGYVLECLRGIGFKLPDMTSQQIYYRLVDNGLKSCEPGRGAILFFGEDIERITHIAIAYSDKLMLEAGGGKRFMTKKMAIASGAGVRLRAINNRRDLVACLKIEV